MRQIRSIISAVFVSFAVFITVFFTVFFAPQVAAQNAPGAYEAARAAQQYDGHVTGVMTAYLQAWALLGSSEPLFTQVTHLGFSIETAAPQIEDVIYRAGIAKRNGDARLANLGPIPASFAPTRRDIASKLIAHIRRVAKDTDTQINLYQSRLNALKMGDRAQYDALSAYPNRGTVILLKSENALLESAIASLPVHTPERPLLSSIKASNEMAIAFLNISDLLNNNLVNGIFPYIEDMRIADRSYEKILSTASQTLNGFLLQLRGLPSRGQIAVRSYADAYTRSIENERKIHAAQKQILNSMEKVFEKSTFTPEMQSDLISAATAFEAAVGNRLALVKERQKAERELILVLRR